MSVSSRFVAACACSRVAARVVLVAALASLVPLVAGAAAGTAGAISADAQAPLTAAEVRRVDRGNARITLRHEEMRHLDMPPMTMVFAVADPAMLEGLSPGMAVRVRVERREGGLVVTRIEPARP